MINSKQQAHSSADAIASFNKIGTSPSLKHFSTNFRAIWANTQQPAIKPALTPRDAIDMMEQMMNYHLKIPTNFHRIITIFERDTTENH